MVITLNHDVGRNSFGLLDRPQSELQSRLLCLTGCNASFMIFPDWLGLPSAIHTGLYQTWLADSNLPYQEPDSTLSVSTTANLDPCQWSRLCAIYSPD